MKAFLQPCYDLDVFVSYAHGPKMAGKDALLRLWTNHLADRLKADLLTFSTEFAALSIWDDRKVDPTGGLTEQLKEVVERAALLIVVMSPHYATSAWCRDERDWFAAQIARHDRGLRNGRDGKVFVVRAIPTADKDWPHFLKDSRDHTLVGFPFHPDMGEDGEPPDPHGWPQPRWDNEDFNKALKGLRTALSRRLRELRGAQDLNSVAAPAGVATAGASQRLYLHAPFGLQSSLRQQVTAQLGQLVGRVLSPPPPVSGSGIAAGAANSRQLVELLAQSCDAVTLLRLPGHDAFEVEAEDIAFGELERVAAKRGRGMPCAVLDADGRDARIFALLREVGIPRFDVRLPDWQGRFQAWLANPQAALP